MSPGAAAGIAIDLAACIVGLTRSGSQRCRGCGRGSGGDHLQSQRNGYDQAARTPGARIIEIDGDSDALEAAFRRARRRVLYFAGAHFAANALPLEDVIEIAHARKVPVMVDAAAQIPPISNLWRFTRELGADAAIFSGGKGLRGPQSSGLVLGQARDCRDVRPNGPPNHSLGRPMKVGKEEMLGILAAVEWSLAQDEPAVLAGYEAIVERWLAGLARRAWDHGGARLSERSGAAARPGDRATVPGNRLDAARPGQGVVGARAADCGWRDRGDSDAIAMNPQTLEAGQDEIVLHALRGLLKPDS